jgi:hypothetical protein
MTTRDYHKIPQMLQQGLTKAEIAAHYGIKVTSLESICYRRCVSLRKGGYRRTVPVRLKPHLLAKLRSFAERRGTTESDLASHLLQAIISSDLYNAVLDDK